MALSDVPDDGVELDGFVLVDEVRLVDPLHVPVGRDGDDAQLVGAHEFRGFCFRGAGHAGEFAVHAEVVLQRHRGEGLVLGLDFDAFFGFDRLVHALVVAAAGENTAGVLVDDEHFAVRMT